MLVDYFYAFQGCFVDNVLDGLIEEGVDVLVVKGLDGATQNEGQDVGNSEHSDKIFVG